MELKAACQKYKDDFSYYKRKYESARAEIDKLVDSLSSQSQTSSNHLDQEVYYINIKIQFIIIYSFRFYNNKIYDTDERRTNENKER